MASQRPRTEDYSGLQVVETPGLELQQARQGLSHNHTWEQPSQLPEAVPQNDTYKEANLHQSNPFANPPQHQQQPYSDAKNPYNNGLFQQTSPDGRPLPKYPGPSGHPAFGDRAPESVYGAGTPASTGVSSPGPWDSISRRHDGTPHDSNSNFASAGVAGPEKNGRLPSSQGRICGLRRGIFWIVLGIGILAIVVAIAVGVGVGVATKNDGSTPTPTTGSNTTTTTTSSPTTTGTSTSSLPAPKTTSAFTADENIICPAANLTLFTMPNTSRKFIMLCGRDYNSAAGAVDLVSANTTTFAKCLDACVKQDGCTAATWGTYYGTGTCFMKAAIGDPGWTPGWYAAVEDDSQS